MIRKPLKLSFRLSEKEADMLTMLQYHCRTWDPSKTMRFALKVLGQVVRDDIPKESYQRLVVDFSARDLVDKVLVRAEQRGAEKAKSVPSRMSDNPAGREKISRPSSDKEPRRRHRRVLPD